MLVVTVQLYPHGDGERAVQIAQMFIYNDRSGDLGHGNYVGVVEPDTRPQTRAAWTIFERKEAKLAGYPRLDKHVWSLVADMIGKLGF